MESETQNGHNPEDEAFQKHIQQMLSNGPDVDKTSVTTTAASLQQTTTVTTATSDVDLNSSDVGGGMSPGIDESPFHAPNNKSEMEEVDISGSAAGYGTASPYDSAEGNYSNTMFNSYPSPSPTAAPTTTVGGNSKLDQVKTQVKEFSLDTLRTTKQLFSEMMGKGTRTVDPKVDVAISELRVLQTTYMKLIDEATRMHTYFSNVLYSQKQITNVLGELAMREPTMAADFNVNAETQRVLIRNGEQLLGAISFFLSNMKTLCTRTIQDCLDTAKKYESARLQYDTYRTEHEQTIHAGGSGTLKSAEIRQKYEERKKKYDQLKDDMVVKLQFLEENKSKVVHRQMLLFHNAIAAYFSGNQKQLESVLSQFSVTLRKPNSELPSWLEK